jgi:hypothetical protein
MTLSPQRPDTRIVPSYRVTVKNAASAGEFHRKCKKCTGGREAGRQQAPMMCPCGESEIARTLSGIADENRFLQSRDANRLVFVARSSQQRDCNFLVLRLETWG